MEFTIKGTIGRQSPVAFHMQVEAQSENHARELALIKLGSKNNIRKSQISILKIEESKNVKK